MLSTNEYLFFRTSLSLKDASEAIGVALEMEHGHNGLHYFVGSDTGFGGIPHYVGGELEHNIYSSPDDPDDREVFDGYPLVWEVWRSKTDEQTQMRVARMIFDEIVDTLRWPVVLVHNLDLLVATWEPGRGIRDFPPDTSVDAEHEHIWR